MPTSKDRGYVRVPVDEEASNTRRKAPNMDKDPDPFFDPESITRPSLWSTQHYCLTSIPIRVIEVANIILFVILLGACMHLFTYSSGYCPGGPEPPYSKVRADGAVEYVNKKFSPQIIFQSEPSDEVDAAWNRTMEYDNTVGLTSEFAAKHGLPRSIPSAHDPTLQIYGVSVFHQLHCLDMIRLALHPERYEAVPPLHYNHCFDFLRQVIMCKADVSMIYWWNTNYTTVEADGSRRDSDYYLSLTPQQREEQSFVKWNVEHQCHDLDLIVKWLDENRIDRYW